MQGGVSVKGEDKEGRKGWRGSFYGDCFSCYGQRAERGCEMGVLRLRHGIFWL
jgi:hypothetical protein